MLLFPTIAGLIAYRTGKLHGRHGLVVEGKAVRFIGLILAILDLTPLCLSLLMVISSALSMPKLSGQFGNVGTAALFIAPVLNILLYAGSFLFAHKVQD